MYDISNYRDLGTINGWVYRSEEKQAEHKAVLRACKEKGHSTRTREINRYTDCVYCPECKYKYNKEMKFKYYVHKIGIFDTNIIKDGLQYSGNYYYTFAKAEQKLYEEIKSGYPLRKIIEIIPDENGEWFDSTKYNFIVYGFSIMPEDVSRYGTWYPKEECLSQLVPYVYNDYNQAVKHITGIHKNKLSDSIYILSLTEKK